MKEVSIKELKEKYKQGLTTLEEERFLFENVSKGDTEFALLSSFKNNQKIEIPTNLNDRLWDSFEDKISDKKSSIKWIWTAAASVALMLSIYFINTNLNNAEELRKQALLEEAKSMFTSKEETIKIDKILFEDETLIVYTRTK